MEHLRPHARLAVGNPLFSPCYLPDPPTVLLICARAISMGIFVVSAQMLNLLKHSVLGMHLIGAYDLSRKGRYAK